MQEEQRKYWAEVEKKIDKIEKEILDVDGGDCVE